ncbi:hypothetical protein [Flavobacterium mekongense]|uniref:hypothetical protein n=1 Tax=Flavobacterium mekongense TaxID=3379707 RepID=UPI00399ABD0D
MPLISKQNIYPQDTNVTPQDYLLGTDRGDNKKTKTYSIASIGAALGMAGVKVQEAYLGFCPISVDEVSLEEQVNHFLSIHSIQVDFNTLMIFKVLYYTGSDPSVNTRQINYYFTAGAGTYNPISSAISFSDLIVDYEKPVSFDLESAVNSPDAQVFDLTGVSGELLVGFLNNSGPYDLSDNSKTYYFRFTDNDVQYLYVFNANSSENGYGIYGSGQLQFNSNELVLIFNSTNNYEIPNIYRKKIELAENNVTGEDIININLNSEQTSFRILSDEINTIELTVPSTEFLSSIAYTGMPLIFINSTATDKKFIHSTASYGFRFPDEVDFILRPKEVIVFRLAKTDVAYFEFTSISRVELGGETVTPTLPQVLAQGDRPVRLSDGDGETILELDDRGKVVYNDSSDFIYIPADLYPVNTVLKVYNSDITDLYCIPSDLNPEIYINGVSITEFSGIDFRNGLAVLKKINGDPFSESWLLTYQVPEFSREALGLELVDNTPDSDKEVSGPQATAIANAQSNAQTYAKNYTDNLKVKTPARIAIDTNVSLTGTLTVGSIILITGDVVLCLSQTDAKQNGLWVVNQTGAWTRTEDFRTGLDVSFALIPVLAGNYAGRMYSTGAGRIVGTNNINLQVTTVFNWGNISGDISTQTDLISLLNKKQDNPLYLSQVDDFSLLTTTAQQRIFSGGVDADGGIPIVAGTRYLIHAHINFIELSAVAKVLNIGFLGTSAASEVSIFAWGVITNETGHAATSMSRINTYAGVQCTASSAAPFGRMFLTGIIECSTSGKLIPSVQINNGATMGKTKKGSSFLAVKLGPITSSNNDPL